MEVISCTRFEVLTAMTMQIAVFCDVMPCKPACQDNDLPDCMAITSQKIVIFIVTGVLQANARRVLPSTFFPLHQLLTILLLMLWSLSH
jgi:hypothetical protein